MSAKPLRKSEAPSSEVEGIGRSPLHSQHLAELNRRVAFPETVLAEGKRGFLASTLHWLRCRILGQYASEQAAFQKHLIQCLNELSSIEDCRWWRMSDEQQATLDSLEKRVNAKLDSNTAGLSERLKLTEQRGAQQDERLETLDSVARGLERILGSMGRPPQGEQLSETEAESPVLDSRYLLLENRYRGSEEEISRRLAPYVEVFRGAELPVLEIGSGRGELLELFREASIPSSGIEMDQAMVALCHEKQLPVEEGEGLAYLSALADSSLGGLVAVQVVEHLDLKQLQRLLELAAQKVAPGGKIVFETINTNSVVALTRNYFRDPTHKQPLHPQTMQFLMEMVGLIVEEQRELSMFTPEAVLQTLPIEEYMTPRWRSAVELLNYNISSLNDLLYGSQDYCVIAVSPPR